MPPEQDKGAYPVPASPLRPELRTVALSAVLAGATFAVLPMFGLLSASVHERVELREAPDIVLHAPPAPGFPLEVRREERPVPRPKLMRRPDRERRKQRIEPLPRSLWARFRLGTSSLAPGAGDFSLEFGLAPEELARPEDARPPVFDLAELDSRPRPLVQVRPVYPFRARERGIEGVVRLGFIVGADGSVREVEILDCEPEGVFERAAKAAARRWRFAPGTKDGKPVASRVRVTVRFRLEER